MIWLNNVNLSKARQKPDHQQQHKQQQMLETNMFVFHENDTVDSIFIQIVTASMNSLKREKSNIQSKFKSSDFIWSKI